MRVQASTLAYAVLPVVVLAGTPPDYDGLSVLWSDDFSGDAGDSVDTGKWTIADCVYPSSLPPSLWLLPWSGGNSPTY